MLHTLHTWAVHGAVAMPLAPEALNDSLLAQSIPRPPGQRRTQWTAAATHPRSRWCAAGPDPRSDHSRKKTKASNNNNYVACKTHNPREMDFGFWDKNFHNFHFYRDRYYRYTTDII